MLKHFIPNGISSSCWLAARLRLTRIVFISTLTMQIGGVMPSRADRNHDEIVVLVYDCTFSFWFPDLFTWKFTHCWKPRLNRWQMTISSSVDCHRNGRIKQKNRNKSHRLPCGIQRIDMDMDSSNFVFLNFQTTIFVFDWDFWSSARATNVVDSLYLTRHLLLPVAVKEKEG